MDKTRIYFLILMLHLLSKINAWNYDPEMDNVENSTQRNRFVNAGVVTNSEICTTTALEILNDDGSAVDAAIAALLCEGITNPQSMGIGGGFLMNIYDAKTQTVQILNAREVAPLRAEQKMFQKIDDNGSGGLTVAVPGEVMGYWAAHQKYGKIGWYDLFRPAIDLATEGTPVTRYTAETIAKMKHQILASPTIKDLLTNPETGQLYTEGEIMRRRVLAETFEQIALHGPHVLYNGSLTADFLYDVYQHGGILTVEDMQQYKAVWNKPIEHVIGDYIFFSAGNPGSGELLMYIIEVMADKLCGKESIFWHRMVETWKFIFGLRASMSGGSLESPTCSKINNDALHKIIGHIKEVCISNDVNDYLTPGIEEPAVEDSGTSHICIYAPNGDAVSVTSTINLSFGAMFVSESTGIILNNEMMDFNLPNHKSRGPKNANVVQPRHYPMSTMLPTIVFDSRTAKIRLIIGGAGGFKILTSTSIVLLSHLFMEMPLYETIAMKRIHHQLMPMEISYENGFSADILQNLQNIGHVLHTHNPNVTDTTLPIVTSCVNGIAIIDDKIYPVGDPRRKAVGNGF